MEYELKGALIDIKNLGGNTTETLSTIKLCVLSH